MNYTRSEKRARTRLLLEQLMDSPSFADQLENVDLDSHEVASFVVTIARSLWMATTSAKLESLSNKLELVFYDAYVAAGGKVNDGIFDEIKSTAVRARGLPQ